MSKISEMDDLFNFSASDVVAQTQTEKKSRVDDFIYAPKLAQSKDGVYRALVRFVPHLKDGRPQFYFGASACYLTKADDTDGIFVYTPKEGRRWNGCPISKVSYELYRTGQAEGNQVKIELSKKIKVNTNYYALIQVVKDAVNSDNNGKFYCYRFGETVRKKLDEAMNGTEFTEAANVFDVFSAPAFEINLSASGKEVEGHAVPSYDACRFISKSVGVTLPDGTVVSADDAESKKALFDFLNSEEIQKINSYRYTPWDAETEAKVKANLATYTGNVPTIKSAESAAEDFISSAKTVETPTVESKPSTSGDDLDAFLDGIL